ncbi:hypothetical protein J2T12_002108 [Paenibacillus anaericanus]|uniref:DUF5680 domain-containing protein n=1 Tax=Paenibacillus anaericanus TaxID=170367 RepID=UPI002789D1B4|nr:DUF5680 domain-containing protein [Paenibacillus anaericanus]MDQ0088698.1 hypothetical protein [Paenibacillus anaericanus]
MMHNEKEFRDFLVEAKRNSYASGNNGVASSRPGTKDILYTKGNYSYLDSYFGGLHFSGQEIVRLNKTAVWGMNYHGRTANPVQRFPEFLLECLMLVCQDAPYRGPASHRNKDFEYECSWNGDLVQFSGEERIMYKGEEIYHLFFHGGEIAYD